MTRLEPKHRKAQILAVGVDLVETRNLYQTNLGHVASACNCSAATVVHYFGGIHQWRVAVVRNAIRHEQLRVLAQAIVSQDPAADDMSLDLRERALFSQLAK